MLAASLLISSNGDGKDKDVLGGFGTTPADDFSGVGLSGMPLLDDINFDDLFVGFDDGDILPDLEVDPAEIFAEFSVSGGEEESAATTTADRGEKVVTDGEGAVEKEENRWKEVAGEATAKDDATANGEASSSSTTTSGEGGDKRRKSSTKSGKRKVKVDWTPELHRRFVQAVEQLGVDKAVPSRILELMGIDCLTRHNIASHLQKYRSHRKHLMAREAEAATWSQRRQMYAGGGGGAPGGGGIKREMSPWIAPTIGFPPPPIQPFRPLHVWGHPTVDQPLLHVWPRHLVPSPPRSAPPPPWLPQPPLQPPPGDPSAYWHPHHYPPRGKEGWVPSPLTPGTPCYPPTMRYPAPPVPGIVPLPVYRPHSPVVPPKQPGSQIQLDAPPSKESIDAAIGDVLSQPWLPLPLGLKPPSLDSVLVELQRQGISKIPPACG